ncbi:hypothetical protein Anapl_00710 [Anas platyrhynchos]|uniref:Uncharacterized protein n=1 Tax=Anas platyrhynchos TaxID=8839 RepID=R0JSP1_ANAPL|nr:hypothetical protein Anapl_00710 [Anas platyrhynchos]
MDLVHRLLCLGPLTVPNWMLLPPSVGGVGSDWAARVSMEDVERMDAMGISASAAWSPIDDERELWHSLSLFCHPEQQPPVLAACPGLLHTRPHRPRAAPLPVLIGHLYGAARSQDVEEQARINQFIRDRFPECAYGDTSWKISSGQRRDGESTGMLSMSECRQPGAGTKQKNKKVMNPGWRRRSLCLRDTMQGETRNRCKILDMDYAVENHPALSINKKGAMKIEAGATMSSNTLLQRGHTEPFTGRVTVQISRESSTPKAQLQLFSNSAIGIGQSLRGEKMPAQRKGGVWVGKALTDKPLLTVRLSHMVPNQSPVSRWGWELERGGSGMLELAVPSSWTAASSARSSCSEPTAGDGACGGCGEHGLLLSDLMGSAELRFITRLLQQESSLVGPHSH